MGDGGAFLIGLLVNLVSSVPRQLVRRPGVVEFMWKRGLLSGPLPPSRDGVSLYCWAVLRASRGDTGELQAATRSLFLHAEVRAACLDAIGDGNCSLFIEGVHSVVRDLAVGDQARDAGLVIDDACRRVWQEYHSVRRRAAAENVPVLSVPAAGAAAALYKYTGVGTDAGATAGLDPAADSSLSAVVEMLDRGDVEGALSRLGFLERSASFADWSVETAGKLAHLVGICHLRRRDWGAALPHLRRAWELTPTPASLHALTIGLCNTDSVDEAREIVDTAAQALASPGPIQAQSVLLAVGGDREGVVALAESFDCESNNTEICLSLAAALIAVGEPTAALDSLSRLLEANAEPSPVVGTAMWEAVVEACGARGQAAGSGSLASDAGLLRSCTQWCRGAIGNMAAAALETRLRLVLARALALLGDGSSAVEETQTILDSESAPPDAAAAAAFLQGVVMNRAGKLDEAFRAFEASARLRSNPAACWNLVVAKADAGLMAEAAVALARWKDAIGREDSFVLALEILRNSEAQDDLGSMVQDVGAFVGEQGAAIIEAVDAWRTGSRERLQALAKSLDESEWRARTAPTLVQFFVADDKWGEAYRWVLELHAHAPSAATHLRAAICAYNAGDLDNAESHALSAFALERHLWKAAEIGSYALAKRGNVDAAAELLDSALEVSGATALVLSRWQLARRVRDFATARSIAELLDRADDPAALLKLAHLRLLDGDPRCVDAGLRARKQGFRDAEVHLGFIGLLLSAHSRGWAVNEPDSAEVGVGVALIRSDGRSLEYVLRAEGDSRNEAFELPISDRLGAAVLGARVGAVVRIEEGSDTGAFTVNGLYNEANAYFRATLREFEVLFPGDRSMRKAVGTDAAMVMLFTGAMERAQLLDRVAEAQDRGAPMGLLAGWLHTNEVALMGSLMLHPSLGVRVRSNAVAAYRAESVAAAESVVRGRLVVDWSSALTLAAVDGLGALPGGSACPVVSEGTVRLFQRVTDAEAAKPRGGGVATYIGGRMVFTEEPAEGEDTRPDIVQVTKGFVEERCTVGVIEGTLAGGEDSLGALSELIGEASAGSVLLARERDAVLLSDEPAVRALAELRFGLKTMSSQAILDAGRRANRIAAREHAESIVKMLACRYKHVFGGAPTLAAALALDEYRPGPHLEAALWLVGTPECPLENAVEIAAEFLTLVWVTTPEIHQTLLVVKVLEALARERSLASADLLLAGKLRSIGNAVAADACGVVEVVSGLRRDLE